MSDSITGDIVTGRPLTRAGRFAGNLDRIINFIEGDLLRAQANKVELSLVNDSLKMCATVKEVLSVKKEMNSEVKVFETFIKNTVPRTITETGEAVDPRAKIREKDIEYFENNTNLFFGTTALQSGAMNMKQLKARGILTPETIDKVIVVLGKMCNQADLGLEETQK